MPRAIWKGAISFGLVTIPVSVYPAASENQLDLDLIDRRDFAPIGYRRINKRTGDEVKAADIVKAYAYDKSRYVVIGDEDFRQANVKATQTVDIQAFVAAADISPCYFDRPYYLEPGRRAEKGYALLREVLQRTGKVGLSTVVLHTRQHLALVIPIDDALVLNTLRYDAEIRPMSALKLPGSGWKKLGVSPKEVAMAERLVADMTEPWNPAQYRDTYRDDLMARIKAKVKSGKTHELTEPQKGAEPRKTAQVIDLMGLLKRSLDQRNDSDRAAASGKPKRSRPRVRSGKPVSVRKRA